MSRRDIDTQAVVSEVELAHRREREARQRLADAVFALRALAAERDRWRALAISASRAARRAQQQHDDDDREDEKA